MQCAKLDGDFLLAMQPLENGDDMLMQICQSFREKDDEEGYDFSKFVVPLIRSMSCDVYVWQVWYLCTCDSNLDCH